MANNHMKRFETQHREADEPPDGPGRVHARHAPHQPDDRITRLLNSDEPVLKVRLPQRIWHPWPPMGPKPRAAPIDLPPPMAAVAVQWHDVPILRHGQQSAPMPLYDPLPGLPGSWPLPQYVEPAVAAPPASENVQPVLDPANARDPPQNARLTAALNQELTNEILRKLPKREECDTAECRRARNFGC